MTTSRRRPRHSPECTNCRRIVCACPVWEVITTQTSLPFVLVIRDTGDPRKNMSVTNGIETVVRELTDDGFLRPGTRFLYYDSSGDLDEVLHDGVGRFLGWRPGERP